MKRPRPTIAGWMVLAAFVAINAALARAFLVDRDFFRGILPIAVAGQVGLAGVILGRGRARRFWVGFEAAGAAGVLALIAADVPDTACNRWFGAYLSFAVNLALSNLPEPVVIFIEEDEGRSLLAAISSAPVLLAAIAGGALAAIAYRRVQPPGVPESSNPSTPDQSRS